MCTTAHTNCTSLESPQIPRKYKFGTYAQVPRWLSGILLWQHIRGKSKRVRRNHFTVQECFMFN